MDFLGLSSTLIPWELCRIDEGDMHTKVPVDKETAKNAPIFGDDEETTPDLEERVRGHYGLQAPGPAPRVARTAHTTTTRRGQASVWLTQA